MIIRDSKVSVIKKNGNHENFNPEKIKIAIGKSAIRANVDLLEEDADQVVNLVVDEIEDRSMKEVSVEKLHTIVEGALEVVSPKVAKSYKDYRNFKGEFGKIMEDVYNDVEKVMYRGDKENANKDSALVSTKKSLAASSLYKEIYKNTFLTDKERTLIKEGDIYVHDMSDRLASINCCLFRMGEVLRGGFEMANVWYNEPKTLDTAFDVISDVVLSAASQQYGGFTVPQVDKILAYYAEKSYQLYYNEYLELGIDPEVADKKAEEKVANDYKQGFQGWEYKFNTVSSSRGDYPFITVTSGLDESRWGHLGNKIMYEVHKEGQGKEGHKKPVLFPKYVFLYDKNLHGEGKPLYDVYQAGLECSKKTMYPDWLSLTGEGYVPSMYKQYKAVVSPMGCRAFLSPYYERGGQEGPADENDKPVFEGRFNSGAISLNLPLIYLRSQAEGKDFFELLDDRLEIIRSIHQRTRDYIGNLYASTNPLAFTQGGFYGGTLNPNQKLKESKELMESTTYSFGITALDELQKAYNGRTLAEDGAFALSVLKHINDKATEFKQEDHMLYAIYGTPAENLCGLQIRQLRKYVGENVPALTNTGYEITQKGEQYVIPGVCDREYVSNSFHCNVREDITPIQKQDLENRFWDYCNGGKIQYVRYPIGYNHKAIDTLVRRAMSKGFYEGCNMALSYCDDCGHQELEMDTTCPHCGSHNLTKIDRMNGYLAYSRVKGDSRLNDAKMAEIEDRVSM